MTSTQIHSEARALICKWVAAKHDLEAAIERRKLAEHEEAGFRIALELALKDLAPIASDTEQRYLLPPTNDERRGVVSLRAYTGSIYAHLDYAEVL